MRRIKNDVEKEFSLQELQLIRQDAASSKEYDQWQRLIDRYFFEDPVIPKRQRRFR